MQRGEAVHNDVVGISVFIKLCDAIIIELESLHKDGW